MPDNVRAMAEQAVSQTGSAPATVNKKQRYFKVPFNPRQVTQIISGLYLITNAYIFQAPIYFNT